MRRAVEDCPHRIIRTADPGTDDVVYCSVARQILGSSPDHLSRVDASVCRACCEHHLPSPGHLNPVVASVVFLAAARVRAEGAATWRQHEEAARSATWVSEHLGIAPRASDSTVQPGSRPVGSQLHWAVGMITAPRSEPTIGRTLRGLRAAGFDQVHIFAEPGSSIPGEFAHLPRTVHGRPLGNLANFFTSLVSLFVGQPNADAYALFQDDVEPARGLRAWCDDQFWPDGVGLVSLYTCQSHQDLKSGWRTQSLGMYRTFGALAFVFRRDVLKEFLTDGRLLEFREAGRLHGDDLVVGEWAARRGIGIAYHTPSLVAHLGNPAIGPNGDHAVSPLTRQQAIASVDRLSDWRPPSRQPGVVGLVGWNTPSGLGYANRDLATHLPVARWLVPTPHFMFPTLSRPAKSVFRIDHVPLTLDHDAQRRWLRGLDWVVFVETCYLPRLAHCARDVGVPVACVPMWELTNLNLDWVSVTDLMLCPTQFTFELLTDWRHRFGFAWDVVHVPWPVDTQRFRYRQRRRCDRFLFVNGGGGCQGVRADGTAAGYRRKGMEVLFEAARLLQPIPFIVYTQIAPVTPVPANVELRPPPMDNARLYDDGDVCVQPSHWEGLGLQLLECQSAGLPLVTTDAPPMNEFEPIRTVPSRQKELLLGAGDHVITSHRITPEDLAAALESVHGTDIREASARARSFVERRHSWDVSLPILRRALSR
jgi:glycosyltransferase involved in cell wall biosynthesis